MSNEYRVEKDLLGDMKIPSDRYFGIHTQRAIENFPFTGRPVHPEFIMAYGTVKKACALTNMSLGGWTDERIPQVIIKACEDISSGDLLEHVVVDCLQGGAGTSTNMNINEVIANRALEYLGEPPGSYDIISPLDDVNLHQSTNDTYPTALRLACIILIRRLEKSIVALQEAFQAKEKEFAHIVKVGRTQFQDAVLTTLGREMSAYAEAFTRDRWRIYKCEERLRVINLGGTAIGTGLGAPKKYIFRAVDELRNLTGIGFARAENLAEATGNADVFVEVSGMLKAYAVTLMKSASDLRILSSGPDAGFSEIILPERQAGSSIMPGKVNPVIPEAVSQAAMLFMGYDSVIANAASLGTLELNQFMPLIAYSILDGISILINTTETYRKYCVEGIRANEDKCREHVQNSTSVATALVSFIGYEGVSRIIKIAKEQGQTIKETVLKETVITADEFDEIISPESVSRLGSPDTCGQNGKMDYFSDDNKGGGSQ